MSEISDKLNLHFGDEDEYLNYLLDKSNNNSKFKEIVNGINVNSKTEELNDSLIDLEWE